MSALLTRHQPKSQLSDPVRRARHHRRGELHQGSHRAGQFGATGERRVSTMTCFVGAHLLDDGPSTDVRLRQALQMTVEMLDHLSFRFGHESQTGAVAGKAGEGTDREGSGVPQRVQQTGPAAQLPNALRAPSEMVRLFARRLHQ